MLCPVCGREIADDAGFCTYCGNKVEPGTQASPLPMPPESAGGAPVPLFFPGLPGDQPRAAASQDRRLALIILGVVVGVAIVIVILAAILMLVLNSSAELETRLTYTLPSGTSDGEILDAEHVLEKRLKTKDIEDFDITHDGAHIYVDLPAIDDLERVASTLGVPGYLQFRQVLDVLAPGDPNYETTVVTMVNPMGEKDSQDLENKEIVLEKEEGDGIYKVRLGPTRLTGNIISNSAAQIDNDNDRWLISFTLTDAATKRFGDLTKELAGQTSPLNQLAIVLDYEIKSFPTIQEAIIDGRGEITGSFTKQEAQDLALAMELGAMPVSLGTPEIESIK